MTLQSVPTWAVELKEQYLAGEASIFLIHGNVRDLQAFESNGKQHFESIRNFLETFLSSTKDIVAYHNVSKGLVFQNRQQETLFLNSVNTTRQKLRKPPITERPVETTKILSLVQQLVTDKAVASAVIMDFFEMVAPSKDMGFATFEDKANLVALQQWSTDADFLATDNLIIIITQNLADVAERFVASPQLATIHIGLPTEEERQRYIETISIEDVNMQMGISPLAKVTAGLSLLQISSLFKSARRSAKPLDFRMVAARKKRIIEKECNGLVEFIAPTHDFSHVGGMEAVKHDLLRIAEAVKTGQTNRVPMGMIFVGPMGTGKTYIAQAFAAESGLTCLKLGNIRGQYVGNTERNLDKVLNLVDALGYVLLIIDEADRTLSTSDNDGGVNSRLIARLKEFMSDTSHRGRVVIMMMTNRPDKLDTDLKRPGRFDMKIPFFFPETTEERQSIFKALVRKNTLLVSPDVVWTFPIDNTEGYSGAELEAVLLNANNLAAEENSSVITQKHLDLSAVNIVKSRDTLMLTYMELLAVFESSSKAMLPPRYNNLSSDEIQTILDLTKARLGKRVS